MVLKCAIQDDDDNEAKYYKICQITPVVRAVATEDMCGPCGTRTPCSGHPICQACLDEAQRDGRIARVLPL